MIDIYNQIWRNTYGSGIPTIINVAVANSCAAQFDEKEIRPLLNSMQLDVAERLKMIINEIYEYTYMYTFDKKEQNA